MTEFTIRDLVEEFGLTLRTLRFWEERQILKPARRGAMRIYSDADRETVRRITAWSDAGLTLLEIREMLSMTAPARNAFLRRRLPEIQTAAEQSHARQAAALQSVLAGLAAEEEAA
ncbi:MULTISPECIES: MerR family transcriptional regulator [Kaistia]|uniref:MerR family transcriptional regulator n=1 Tax=Kaistia nematophila TaxID=2994654 RepID=A0A9X3E3B3_9HYPH|nr:MerR family transcriptional regulator [Kaistia nematophila]MCX5570582.1 MerR family transcriptional regulator [Kaistia nematophila]